MTRVVSLSLPQGQLWSDLQSCLHQEILTNLAWKKILFANPNSRHPMDVTINYYRCEVRTGVSAPVNYLLEFKDAKSPMWFIDLMDAPQMTIEIPKESGTMQTGQVDKNLFRTYRYAEPKMNLFISYEGFGRFSDSLISFQYDQTGVEKKVSTSYPTIDETDEDLLVVLDLCRYVTQASPSQSCQIQYMARALRKLLEAMQIRGQVPSGALEVRKSKNKYGETDDLAVEIWVNRMWPVGLCVAGIEGANIEYLEEYLMRLTYDWSCLHYGKEPRFLRAKRLPFFGTILSGSYLQFVGLQFVPKREMGLYRFTDLLSLIHQTDDSLERERQLLVSFQSLLMSCLDLGLAHEKESVLRSQLDVDAALQQCVHPCHRTFKLNGEVCELVYGNPAQCADPISNHAGSATQIFAATSPSLPGRELVVKFCSRYGETAHRFLARRGWAPRVHCVQEIPGRLRMVVMDRSPGYPLSLLVYNFMEAHPTVDLETVQDAFAPYLRQLRECIIRLHKKGLVHGDVRSPNVIIDDSAAKLIQLRARSAPWPPSDLLSPRTDSTRDSSGSSSLEESGFGVKMHLIDFDWAGDIGTAKYPTLLNRRTNFPDDAQRAGYIRPSHDLQMLANICRMPYDLWRNRRVELHKQRVKATFRE
eukprot:Gregarina_sp_Poly_1__10044@NODE_674_length_6834_cov_113_052608_g508_i0_p1_GENE_NODE_674_length_6834_cov_113_052608_g508_i0NODE_674_length_6834_cov_113_052608_g508_i0_p1_ORF_typecomplete_len698_score81_65WaaY/PF06176_11/1_5e08Kdo/PF06293_14/9e05RIO1/PF01163_22/9_3e05Pkinase_fungal/PF17667_1/8_7e02Pkinase_fungal/PF17667_1/0_00071Pkinase/PF00069_25/0_00083APH/PF01636_23/0_0017Pkinase_Tyr/PF07714_17/0_1Kinaselike/PF14531_6/0_2_NODE_674_length_6834_cov_113_052608_g508_i01632094